MVEMQKLNWHAVLINKEALHKSSMTDQSTINKKCDFYLSHIINNLKVIDNGGT